MKDLIERDHALAAVALGDTVNQLQAKIRAIPRAPAPDPAAIREAALREAAALIRPSLEPSGNGIVVAALHREADAILALIQK